jgi:hypothetical protein
VEVVASTDPAHPARISEVADGLARAGLRDVQVLDAVGVITGTVDDDADLEALRQVAGVAAVEPSREVGIPPPDAPVQ